MIGLSSLQFKRQQMGANRDRLATGQIEANNLDVI